jgi:glucosyl-dolichyl phosphate glucuronosyltransferase
LSAAAGRYFADDPSGLLWAEGARGYLSSVRFSHVIPTKDRPDGLRAVLESSLSMLPAGSEVIVVDGDPQRSGEAVVRELQASNGYAADPGAIRYISSAPGLTIQRNRGIDAATGEVVLFTDDDCVLEPGIFEALASAYADDSLVGATGRVIQDDRGRIGSDQYSRLRRIALGGGTQGTMTWFGFRRPIVDLDRAHDVEYMPGPFMSARRAVAAAVRFDERLAGYALGEDDDFSFRLSRTGRLRFVPEAAVHHREEGQRAIDQRMFNRNLVINRAYLLRKNFGGKRRTRLRFAALIAVFCLHRIVNREWDGLRGLLDGLRAIRSGGGADALWIAPAGERRAGERPADQPG